MVYDFWDVYDFRRTVGFTNITPLCLTVPAIGG